MRPGRFCPGHFCPGHFHILPIARALPDFSISVKFCQRMRRQRKIFPALPLNGVYSIHEHTFANIHSSEFSDNSEFSSVYTVCSIRSPSAAVRGSEAAQSLKFQRSCKILRFGSSCCADTRCAKELQKSCDGRLSFRFKELRLFSRRKRAANLTFLVKFFNYFFKNPAFSLEKFDFKSQIFNNFF